ncbi:MAG TPA: lysophospholipid acyltransferase family protein [Ktedonobacterales bacterium]
MAKPKQAEGHGSRLVFELTRLFGFLVIPLIARFRTEGVANVPRSGPVILAMNHIHWTDIPLAALHVPRITHYMAKVELFGKPVLGGYIRKMGAFPVRRGEGDREAIRTAERLLAEGEIVAIFPEGHRSDLGPLIPAHSGAGYIALRSGVPIVPVAISGTRQIFKGFHYGPFRPKVTIRYGKPFTLGASGKVSKEALGPATDEIMRRIAAMLPPEQRGAYAEAVASGPAEPKAQVG